jgi:alpha-tubulin suppressor-like RCC1 family protein
VAPEPIRVGTGTNWTEVSVGGDHTCARRTAGDTLCWGNNFFGQLGRGTTGMAHTPRRVDGKQWTELGAAVGLDTGGALWYWDNDQIRLAPESTFTALADTDRYGCALRSPGITSCWRLDRTLAPPPIAIAIESTAPLRQIAAGYYHGCGIRVDGGLWCWGSNYYGEVGDGTRVDRAAPVRVGDASDWIGVRTRYLHTCAIEAPGALYCWGDNRAGAIGDGTIVEQHAPARVGVGTDWTDVVPGFGNTCALRADKTLWCWGEQRSPVPAQVGSDADWDQISLGGNFMCGLRSPGKLFCWGSGFAGQLGQGTLSSGVPSQVGTDADWTAVVAGEAHACALKTDGSRWCWGANAHGELGDGTSWSPDPAPVAF